MQFVDLKKQYDEYRREIDAAMAKVMNSAQFIMGPEIKELETALSAFTGSRHAISCASGTDALLLVLMAKGVGPGDEIITTPFTFIATAEVISLLGATPVFVDIEERTFNINPALIEKAITPRTKGLLPVSLYGQAADMDAINAIAKKHGLWVMEDACQSFGASHKGIRSCNLSDFATTSFFPAKPLGCYGDGGAIFTNDDAVADVLCAMRNHGQKERYRHSWIGINGRLDTLQAAVLLVKLRYFESEIKRRNERAAYYTAGLAPHVKTPEVLAHNVSVYAQYTIRVKNREALAEKLKARGIPTAVHYPVPLHMQQAFSPLGYAKGSLPVSERVSEEVLSLPMYAQLPQADQDKVISAIVEAVRE